MDKIEVFFSGVSNVLLASLKVMEETEHCHKTGNNAVNKFCMARLHVPAGQGERPDDVQSNNCYKVLNQVMNASVFGVKSYLGRATSGLPTPDT